MRGSGSANGTDSSGKGRYCLTPFAGRITRQTSASDSFATTGQALAPKRPAQKSPTVPVEAKKKPKVMEPPSNKPPYQPMPGPSQVGIQGTPCADAREKENYGAYKDSTAEQLIGIIRKISREHRPDAAGTNQ